MIVIEREVDLHEREANRVLFPRRWQALGVPNTGWSVG